MSNVLSSFNNSPPPEAFLLEFVSGVTGRGEGQSAPQRFLTGKFLLTYREKKRQGKKGKG